MFLLNLLCLLYDNIYFEIKNLTIKKSLREQVNEKNSFSDGICHKFHFGN